MKAEAAASVQSRGATLAGSIITVGSSERFETARGLVVAGALIHADVFSGSYDLMEGASDELVRRLSREWPTSLDVHIMADDLPEAVAALPLARRVRRITLHVRQHEHDALSGIRALVEPRAEEFWISTDSREWTPQAMSNSLDDARPDGVLQMLAPAGVPGTQADQSKTAEPSWAVAHAHGALGVDGGVQPEAIDGLVAAGVSYFVLGRALLG